MQNNAIPTWFNGTIYAEGAWVENPFSKEEYKLSAVELSIYDFIIGTEHVMETAPKAITTNQFTNFNKALGWFRDNNAEAYMALLD